MTKFNIGDTVYQATADQTRVWITCPECLGSGRLRVIMGDDSEVSIACACCDRGYEGSPGKLSTYQFLGKTTEHYITGVESRIGDSGIQTRYSFGCWSTEEENIFATREEAADRVTVLVTNHEFEEAKNLRYKEKQTKTWAQNVAYWRAGIRRAKDDIARYEARLAVAPKNLKDADNNV